MEARNVTASSRHCPTATSRDGVQRGRTHEAMIGVTLQRDRDFTGAENSPSPRPSNAAAACCPVRARQPRGLNAQRATRAPASKDESRPSRRTNRSVTVARAQCAAGNRWERRILTPSAGTTGRLCNTPTMERDLAGLNLSRSRKRAKYEPVTEPRNGYRVTPVSETTASARRPVV